MKKERFYQNGIVRKVAFAGMLSALAVAFSALESLLTPVLPPGAKPGLANIAVMLGAQYLGFGGAVAVTVVKSVFVLATRGTVAFMMSFAGSVVSAIVTVPLLRNGKGRVGSIGVGIVGALTHNAMQLAVSVSMMGKAMLWYSPALIMFALVNGTLTGTILHFTMKKLVRWTSVPTDGKEIK